MRTFTDTNELREALVDLVKAQGINQHEISINTGLTQGAISLFISGKRSLNGDSTLKIQNFIRGKSMPTPASSLPSDEARP